MNYERLKPAGNVHIKPRSGYSPINHQLMEYHESRSILMKYHIYTATLIGLVLSK